MTAQPLEGVAAPRRKLAQHVVEALRGLSQRRRRELLADCRYEGGTQRRRQQAGPYQVARTGQPADAQRRQGMALADAAEGERATPRRPMALRLTRSPS